MTGLIILGMIVVYIIYFYLKGILVETISFIKSGRPYPALHPVFTKCTGYFCYPLPFFNGKIL